MCRLFFLPSLSIFFFISYSKQNKAGDSCEESDTLVCDVPNFESYFEPQSTFLYRKRLMVKISDRKTKLQWRPPQN